MDTAEKLSITLPSSLAKIVRDKVKTGAYASNSEVIREALRAWQEQQMERDEHLASIRARIDEALNDPRPSIPAKEVFEHLRDLHRSTVKKRARK